MNTSPDIKSVRAFHFLKRPDAICPADTQEYRRAMWIMNRVHVIQYLLSHTTGRQDGAKKAHHHRVMTEHYVATLCAVEPDDVMTWCRASYDRIHDTTAHELTNHLDREVGLKPDSYVSDEMAERFFIAFHLIAMRSFAVAD